jgi:stalled ribosome rescue protein Dom34
VKNRTKYRRGYPVAILAGLEKDKAVLWRIYSNVAKHEKTISLDRIGSDSKTLYNFHEAVINALRPALKEGVRSIIVASPPRTNCSKEFINHVRQHHAWLNQGSTKVVISEIVGTAGTPSQVAAISKTAVFHELVEQTTSEETDDLVELLDRRLNLSNSEKAVLFSLEEAEVSIIKHRGQSKLKPEYLLLTDEYLQGNPQKNRLNRLIQIAANKSVKTRIINAESPAGKRISQLGGLVCLMKESE